MSETQSQSIQFPHGTAGPLRAEGLYDPANEHDACGVGFIVNIKGERNHDILLSGLEILVNLSHRGACGCDPLTGDGCGVLTQMPDELLRPATAEIGFELPPSGQYGAGAVFLPCDDAQRGFCQRRLEEIVVEEGQKFLGWREVPVDNRALGWLARSVEPAIRQIFIGRGADTPADMFEWKLYVVRKRIENEIRASELSDKKFFYIPSLSSRVLVYKGLMQPEQAEGFYRDLSDERYVSALALVHQRYSTNTFPTIRSAIWRTTARSTPCAAM
jgi:glutamate synthase (NADPH/NADH) large chain